jgi:hypothetical protein
MESFAVPTPTSSGNYKPNLESFLVEIETTRQARGKNGLQGLERDADLLAGYNIAATEAIDLDNCADEGACLALWGYTACKGPDGISWRHSDCNKGICSSHSGL